MRLKELRMQHNLLQKDVAEILNCSTPVYCRYEKGDREPPFGIIQKLAEYYGVTVDYLMGADNEDSTTAPQQPGIHIMARSSVPDVFSKLNEKNRAIIEDLALALFAAQDDKEKRSKP